MGLNDDLKINFDKVGKACRQVGEEWEKMLKENNPFDTFSNIAKDIIDRTDREKALEFTKCIGKLLRENGITPMIEEYRCGGTLENDSIIEEYYGVAITGLDFKEHDKKFKDEITQLKHDLDKVTTRHDEFKKEAQDMIAELQSELEVKDNLMKIKNGLCGNDETKDKEPIEIAMDIIKGRNKDDLEQIAQHIQVYCRYTRSRCDDTIAF